MTTKERLGKTEDLRKLASRIVEKHTFDSNGYDCTGVEPEELAKEIYFLLGIIEDMRSENKLHGHITDASAKYLIWKSKESLNG